MRDIVYQDQFITIVRSLADACLVQTESSLYGGRSHTIASKGMERFWIYNADQTIQYSHNEFGRKFGYKTISTPKEGIVRLEFAEGQWYFLNVFGKLISKYSFKSATEFQNGFASVGVGVDNIKDCLIDHDGHLYIQDEHKITPLPDDCRGGFRIDDNHIALYKNGGLIYLYDNQLHPIVLKEWNGDLHINFERYEVGPLSWCIYLINCSCFANHSVRAKRCVFNLITNTVVFSEKTNYDLEDNLNYSFTPLGGNCIRLSQVVKTERKEWDSDDRRYYYYKSDYIRETLCFKDGSSYSDMCTIECLPGHNLILIKGASNLVNNNNVISNSGCLSYLGDVVVPVIYSSIKLSDNLLEVVLEEHQYKYTFSGQLVHNGEVLPSGVHAYEQLKDNILIVKQYTGRAWDISFLHGIYDVNAKNFIIPVEYTSLIDTTSNTFIVCKGGKYGLLNKDYNLIITCKYASLNHIAGDLYICSIEQEHNSNIRFAVINLKEETIIASKYHQISIIEQERISFKSYHEDHENDSLFGECEKTIITDFKLNTIVTQGCEYPDKMSGFWDIVGKFANGICRYIDNDGKWGLVSADSQKINKCSYDYIYSTNIGGIFIGRLIQKFYLINTFAHTEAPICVDDYHPDKGLEGFGLILVSKNNLYGLVGLRGNIVLQCEYSLISAQSNHIRLICNNWCGQADLHGNVTIPCKYSYLGEVSNGMIIYAIGGHWSNKGKYNEKLQSYNNNNFLIGAQWGIMNEFGNIIYQPFADFIRDISEGKSSYRIGNKYGILDLHKKQSHLTDYNYLSTFHEGKCIAAKYKKGSLLQYGYINDDYTELVPCEYDSASTFENGVGILLKGNTQYTIDKCGNIINTQEVANEEYDDYYDDTDWEEETWYAMTDGQYGDYPGSGVDYDFLGR